MMEEQQATKYISKYSIEECVILHNVFSIDEARNKTLKIERPQSRDTPFRQSTHFEEPLTGADSQLSVDQPITYRPIDPPAAALETAAAPAKNKKNPYAKPGVGKCYRYGEPGHKSNKCPKRRQVNMSDYKEDEEEEFEIEEPDDFDFAEEHGNAITCIVQKLLCNQKASDTTQRQQIFYLRCSVKNKVCNLIMDKGSCKNIMFRVLVEHLKLETEPDPLPYTLGWIKKSPSINRFLSCSYFNW